MERAALEKLGYDRLYAQEESLINWISKTFGTSPQITPTSKLKLLYIKDFGKEVVFKQSISSKIGMGAIVLIVLGVLSTIVHQVFIYQPYSVIRKYPLLYFGPVYIVIFYIVYFTYKNLWKRGEIKYLIVIDGEGIRVKHQKFKWDNILATYMVKRYRGKNLKNLLAILLDNEEVLTYDISEYNCSPEKLSTYIEHFKPNA